MKIPYFAFYGERIQAKTKFYFLFKLGYRKIPKISPGVYIFSKALFEGLIFRGTYIRRGLSTEGNLRFKTDWVSLIVGSKFTVFALFYFVFEGNFPSTSPRGVYIWRGDLAEGFFALPVWGALFGGAYFRNFTVFLFRFRKVRLHLTK